MKKTKIYWLIASLALLSATIVGCGAIGNGESKAPDRPANINIATSTTGGVYYPLGNAMSQLFNQKLQTVRTSAQATAGTPQNILLMQKKEAEISFAQNGVAYYAYNGREMFINKPDKTLRAMTHLYPTVMHIVVNDNSGITSIKQFEGKHVVPCVAGSTSEINSKEILRLYGLDYKDSKNLNADYLDCAEAAEALKEGRVDGIMIAGCPPAAAIIDTASSLKIRILSLEPDMIQKLISEMPWYYEVTIPKGTYSGQDEDVRTVAVANILICREDLAADLVYSMTKTLHENQKNLITANDVAKNMTLERALDGLTVPLHPGAQRYYKEKGLNINPQP